jgi:hypothetical protein
MKSADRNILGRLDRRRRNLPLMISAAILFVILVIAAAVAFDSGAMAAGFTVIAAIVIYIGVVLLDNDNRKRIAATDDRRFIQWNAAPPEVQRQSVILEVRELSRLLGVGDEQLNDLLSAYVVAEDLALRQIQQEENLPLMRHVSIGDVPFDAVLVDHDLLICIEVSFLVVPDVRREKVESVMKKIAQAKKNLYDNKSRLRLRLMLVLVTQLTADEDEELEEILLSNRFRDNPVDVDIRRLDFEMLQRVYISE